MPLVAHPEEHAILTRYFFASPCRRATAELWITYAATAPFAYLWDLSVAEAYQGQGIGGALLDETIAFVRARALPYLLQPATAAPDVDRLRRFYRAHGFVDTAPQAGTGLVGMILDPVATGSRITRSTAR